MKATLITLGVFVVAVAALIWMMPRTPAAVQGSAADRVTKTILATPKWTVDVTTKLDAIGEFGPNQALHMVSVRSADRATRIEFYADDDTIEHTVTAMLWSEDVLVVIYTQHNRQAGDLSSHLVVQSVARSGPRELGRITFQRVVQADRDTIQTLWRLVPARAVPASGLLIEQHLRLDREGEIVSIERGRTFRVREAADASGLELVELTRKATLE